MIFYITRRIKHNLVKGLAMAILLGFLGWFLLLFNGFITQKQIEIDRAYETMPVSVVISNLQGTQTDNLWIPESVIDYFIRDSYSYLGKQEPVAFSSYVKDVKIKSTLYYTITANPALADKGESQNQKIVGITSAAAEPALSQTEGVQIHYFVRDGEAKLGSGEPVCIVSESFLDSLTMDADGKYRMVLQVHTSPDANEAKTISVEIIGCYTKADNTIYCSWNTVAEIQKLLSGEIIADSLEATIRDNRELDAFRVLLKRHFAQVNPTGEPTPIPNAPVLSYFRYAATIHDQHLQQTVRSLSQNMKTLQLLLPVVVVLALIIAFFAGFLYVYVQKKPLAVARSLGTSKNTVLLSIVLENLVWIAVGVPVCLGLLRLMYMGHRGLTCVAAVNFGFLAGAWIAGYVVCGKKAYYSLKEDE